jgi:hypothetical protein
VIRVRDAADADVGLRGRSPTSPSPIAYVDDALEPVPACRSTTDQPGSNGISAPGRTVPDGTNVMMTLVISEPGGAL